VRACRFWAPTPIWKFLGVSLASRHLVERGFSTGIGVEKKKEIDRDAEAARLRKLRNEARYAGDYQRVNEIAALIREFNEANPRHMIKESSVEESWERFKAEAKRARKTGGVSFSDEDSAAAEAIVEAESLKNQQQNK